MEQQLPKFQEIFLPILKVLNENGPLRTRELYSKIQGDFYSALPKELLAQKTKDGELLIVNRIAWAKTYLKQGGLIDQPERALVRITEKGQKVLKKGSLPLKELLHDEEFLARRVEGQKRGEEEEKGSPQDLIESGARAVEDSVKRELSAKLKDIDPYYFQKVIQELLKKMGYGEIFETPKSGDGGIDGVMNLDKLGLEKIYIQAKRYTESKVRESEIRNFIGAMSRDTNKGIFVTTSEFDEKAKQKAHNAQHKIILIDGSKLVELMYKYGIGVQLSGAPYEIKEVDDDFFEAK